MDTIALLILLLAVIPTALVFYRIGYAVRDGECNCSNGKDEWQ